MNVFLLSYDLKKPGQSYTPLHEVLKKATSWWHYLESTWLIASDEPLSNWQNRIRSVTDANDSFLLIALSPNAERQGWLAQEAWDWIDRFLG